MKTRKKASTSRIFALAALGMASLLPIQAQATCSTEPYLGSICMTAATFCPQGYAQASGQLMAINQNQALFSLVGTQYGGDGQTTFGLPDLRGRTPVGLGQGNGLSMVTQGQLRGSETSSLSIAHLAHHNHAVTIQASSASIPVSSSTQGNAAAPDAQYPYLAASGGGQGKAAIWSSSMTAPVSLAGEINVGPVLVSSAGLGQPFSNLPPQIGLRYCIATQGMFPLRD